MRLKSWSSVVTTVRPSSRLRGAPRATSPLPRSETSKSTTRSIAPRGSSSRSKTSEPPSTQRGAGDAWMAVVRRTPSRPTSENPSGPASGGGRSCLGTIPRSSSIGWKSAPTPHLQREPDRVPVVAANGDPLAHRAGGLDVPLHAQPQRLARAALSVRQLEVGVGELVDGLGPGGVGGGEEARQLPADAQLVHAEEAAVPEPQAQGVLDVGRQAAVGHGHQEDVAVLDDDRVGEVPQLAEGTIHTNQHCIRTVWVEAPDGKDSHEDRDARPTLDRDPAARLRRDRAGDRAARGGAHASAATT